jgi:hypothetical protein
MKSKPFTPTVNQTALDRSKSFINTLREVIGEAICLILWFTVALTMETPTSMPWQMPLVEPTATTQSFEIQQKTVYLFPHNGVWEL